MPLITDGIFGYGITRLYDQSFAASLLPRIYTTADYFLGTNPLNMTWVSGLAERHPTNFMHLDAWYNGQPTMNIGYVPYGPWVAYQDYNRWPGYSHIECFYSNYPVANFDTKDVHLVWPQHERWYNSRYAVATGEFTIDQTNLNAAVCHGAATLSRFTLGLPPAGDDVCPSRGEPRRLASGATCPAGSAR